MTTSRAEEPGAVEKRRKKKEKQACTVQAPRPRRLIKGCFRVADAWDQAILSNPATVARNVPGQKGGMEIEAPLFIRSAHFGAPCLVRFPEISYPVESEILCTQSRQGFYTPRQHLADGAISSVGNFLNGSRRLNRR